MTLEFWAKAEAKNRRFRRCAFLTFLLWFPPVAAGIGALMALNALLLPRHADTDMLLLVGGCVFIGFGLIAAVIHYVRRLMIRLGKDQL
ncbi:MAG: hypothetical protein V4707_14305 [Pseudomonadota bacterium]